MMANWLTRFEHFGCLSLVALAVWGCSSASEQLGQVAGRVSLGGQPLSAGEVLFSDESRGIHIVAPINAEGQYRVEIAAGSGLPLGRYQVAVLPPTRPAAEFSTGPLPASTPLSDLINIPPRFQSPQSSGLNLEVKLGAQQYDIALLSEE